VKEWDDQFRHPASVAGLRGLAIPRFGESGMASQTDGTANQVHVKAQPTAIN
jgi:hypothetical protein